MRPILAVVLRESHLPEGVASPRCVGHPAGNLIQLLPGTLHAAKKHQHAQVHRGYPGIIDIIFYNLADDQDPSRWAKRISASAEDTGSMLVVPVMQDGAKNVDVLAQHQGF